MASRYEQGITAEIISPPKCEVLTAKEMANGAKKVFMESLNFSRLRGKYLPLNGEMKHDFGELPDKAHNLMRHGRGMFYLSWHTHQNTSFAFGGERAVSNEPFLALNWVAPVDKKNNQAERTLIRLDGFSPGQATTLLNSFLSEDVIKPINEGDNLISFDSSFDPFSENEPLIEHINNISGLKENHRTVLIDELRNFGDIRRKTHNAELNNYKLEMKYQDGKIIVFDQALQQWVFLSDTTNNLHLLSVIKKGEKEIGDYLANPHLYKYPPRFSYAVALSSRTAGLRPGPPKGAETELAPDLNGNITQNTTIKPLSEINPDLFNGLQLLPSEQPEISPILPIMPIFYPIRPILSAGGGFIIDLPDTLYEQPTPTYSVITAQADQDITQLGVTAFALSLVTPATVGFMNGAISVAEAMVPVELVDIINEETVALDTSQTEEIAVMDSIIPHEIPDLNPENHLPDFPPEPDFPPVIPEPGGGGGRALPQKINTVWDNRMKERFEEVNKPKVLYEAVVPQNNHTETVVFETKKVDVKSEVATRFYEYTSTIEVVSVEVPEDIPLLASSPQQEEKTEAKINNKNLKIIAHEYSKSNGIAALTTFARDDILQPQIMFDSLAQTYLKNIFEQKELNSPLQQFMNQVMQNMPVVNVGAELKEDLQFERPVGVRQKKTNIKTKIKIRPSLSFLALLFLTKIKLQSAINTRFLLFLLNPKLFLIPATTKI